LLDLCLILNQPSLKLGLNPYLCLFNIEMFWNDRCIYLTYLKNPAIFQDDFWCRFLFIWTLMAATIWNGTLIFRKGPKLPISYFMCTGINVTKYSLLVNDSYVT